MDTRAALAVSVRVDEVQVLHLREYATETSRAVMNSFMFSSSAIEGSN